MNNNNAKPSIANDAPMWVEGLTGHSWYPMRCSYCYKFPVITVLENNTWNKQCVFCGGKQ